MRLVVSVPVLSEQMAVALPMVSQASRCRTRLLSLIIFWGERPPKPKWGTLCGWFLARLTGENATFSRPELWWGQQPQTPSCALPWGNFAFDKLKELHHFPAVGLHLKESLEQQRWVKEPEITAVCKCYCYSKHLGFFNTAWNARILSGSTHMDHTFWGKSKRVSRGRTST